MTGPTIVCVGGYLLVRGANSLRASSPLGSRAIFILGDIYLGLARDLGANRERIGWRACSQAKVQKTKLTGVKVSIKYF